MDSRHTMLVRILAIAMSLSVASPLCLLPVEIVSSGVNHKTPPVSLRPARTPLSCLVSSSRGGGNPSSRRSLKHLPSCKHALLLADIEKRISSRKENFELERRRLGCSRRGDATRTRASSQASGKPEPPESARSDECQASDEGFHPQPIDEPTFRDLFADRLPEWILSRMETLGFVKPTLVQREALEVILGGCNDAILHAQTGSGKTLAFLVPLLASVDPSRAAVQGLVVVPTRELGLQVAGVAKRLAAATGSATGGKIQVMSVLEGSSNKRQRAWAWAEPPHVVIGNPESLSRLVTSGAVRVNAVSYVVVDEVDACLLSEETRASLHELLARSLSPTHATADEDQQEEEGQEAARLLSASGLGRVGGAAPVPVVRRVKERQTVFASATVPQHKHFIRQCVQRQWTLSEPVHVQVHAKEAMPSSLSHFYVVCPPEQKLPVLRALLKRELGLRANANASARGLVFASAAKPLEKIAPTLERALVGGGENGVGDGHHPPLAECLREELGLNARADVMSMFREGRTRVLLSTDMAARGLDVPEISHVFNLDLPKDGEGYVHRGGRAGRLGRPGKVISIITPPQEFVVRRLGNAVGIDIKRVELGSRRREPSTTA